MKIKKLGINGVYEIESEGCEDDRGFISHVYSAALLEEHGLNSTWVKEYHSHTKKKYTVRGLYIQLPPHVEGKLITASKGKMMWVFADLRKESESFGKWDSVILSEKYRNSLYLPQGFANGCVSLSDNCDVYIKADNHYSEAHGVGIIWNDKELKIDWRLHGNDPLISEAHRQYKTFKEFKDKYSGI